MPFSCRIFDVPAGFFPPPGLTHLDAEEAGTPRGRAAYLTVRVCEARASQLEGDALVAALLAKAALEAAATAAAAAKAARA
eukprot:4015146-Heterocapsa_arctica.AAC.1